MKTYDATAHLHGFYSRFDMTEQAGWISELFEPYRENPYIEPTHQKAVELLSKRKYFGRLGRLVPIFAEHLSVCSLVNSMIGVQILRDDPDKPTLVSQLHSFLEEEKAKQTLGQQIAKTREKLAKAGRSFGGVATQSHGNSSPTLKERKSGLDGELIVLEGTVCATSSLQDLELRDTFNGAEISWILIDVPYPFTASSEDWPVDAVGIQLGTQLKSYLNNAPPFDESVSWYPYVRIYGTLKSQFSPQHRVMTLEVAWLEFRRPEVINAVTIKRLTKVLTEGVGFVAPVRLISTNTGAATYLAVVQLLLAYHDRSLGKADPRLVELVKSASAVLEGSPPEAVAEWLSGPGTQ